RGESGAVPSRPDGPSEHGREQSTPGVGALQGRSGSAPGRVCRRVLRRRRGGMDVAQPTRNGRLDQPATMGWSGSPRDRKGAAMTTNHRKVVARYADGRLVKGYTFDFAPANPRFHVFSHPAASGPSTQVLVRELKAVF